MRSDERRWVLLRSFYGSWRAFHALFDRYECSVLDFARRYGVDRRDLQLPPEELATLLDANALRALRDGDLESLRGASHALFRTASATDPFDVQISSIYHEVSILKEEHGTIRESGMQADPAEYERYYREVNIYYPKRLKHVRNLYGRSRRRLEQILPTFGQSQVIVRSAYLFGEGLVRDVYRGGVEEFYRHMYPEGGALRAYTLAGQSFLRSGFGPEAVSALDQALLVAGRPGAAEDAGLDAKGLADAVRKLTLERERARELI